MTLFLVSAISIATVLLYGCVGEIITEKAGHLNLGIPGIMCMGTAGGCLGVSLYMGGLASPTDASWILLVLISLLFSMAFAAALGGVYALLTVTLRCNQNITGLAITIFGGGATNFIMSFVDRTHFDPAGKLISSALPFAGSLEDAVDQLNAVEGLLGPILFDHNDLGCLDHFKGGEPLGALEAFAAAADAVALFNGAGIDDLEIGATAGGTFHIGSFRGEN